VGGLRIRTTLSAAGRPLARTLRRVARSPREQSESGYPSIRAKALSTGRVYVWVFSSPLADALPSPLPPCSATVPRFTAARVRRFFFSRVRPPLHFPPVIAQRPARPEPVMMGARASCTTL